MEAASGEQHQSKPEWRSFDEPIVIGRFDFGTKNTAAFNFPSNIVERDSKVKKVRILSFLRCGNEPPSRSFTVRIWTKPSNVHYTKGARYGQAAISFLSEERSFDVGSGMLFVQSDDIQQTNCHCMEFSIVAVKE